VLCAKAPDSVVAWLGAMQSREFAYARWSVAQCAIGCRAGEVYNAVERYGTFLEMPAKVKRNSEAPAANVLD